LSVIFIFGRDVIMIESFNTHPRKFEFGDIFIY